MKNIFWKIVTILFWIFVTATLVWKVITFFDEDFFTDICNNHDESTDYSWVEYRAVWHNDSISVYHSKDGHYYYVLDDFGFCVLDSIDEIQPDFKATGSSPIWFRKGNLRGYISSSTGHAIIPAQYDKAWFFREGKAAVLKEQQLMFINEQGEVILDDDWEDAGWVDFVFKNNHCVVCKNDKLGLIDGDGNYIVQPECIDIITRDNGYYIMKENFEVSRYDWDGHLEQSMCFYSIEPIEDENGYTMSCFAYRTEPNHVGLMDADGNILCPPCYRRIQGVTDRLYLGYRDDYDYDRMQLGELIQAGY
ncbi:MAG: WG repeat-containing protein [Paludibacteraceae bacterium]|nr:WG repeat-containing protein [Paludibacteraceae bacterium]